MVLGSNVACYSPLSAFQCSDGRVVFNERGNDVVRQLQLPCGQCIGCRLERSRQWAMRCVHEASLYPKNCFITLTYSDNYYPENGSLHYPDFQLFMKRLRKGNRGVSPSVHGNFPIRFYMAGEYGATKMRPHFHACLFNFDFVDKYEWMRSPSGELLYRSPELERLWPFGFSSIGQVTFESAAYVARYIMKKVTGDLSSDHYIRVNESSGEIISLTPEFNKMSLKPGIASDWYDKYKHDVHTHDYVVINGKRCRPPRYYDNKLKQYNPYDFDWLMHQREQKRLTITQNVTPMLDSQLTVVKQQINFLKRNLD